MTVLSTKRLQPNQRELLLNAGLRFVEYDAIEIKACDFRLPSHVKNVIITSQNGARAFIQKKCQPEILRQVHGDNAKFFVVGEKTASLLMEKELKVLKIAQNGAELGHFIAKNYKNEHFTYVCGNHRRDELPTILKAANVVCEEIVVYETHNNLQTFEQTFDGVLFYSPSGVNAFAKANPLSLHLKTTISFCIGETTAAEARKYSDYVVTANSTSVESVIAKAVKTLKNYD